MEVTVVVLWVMSTWFGEAVVTTDLLKLASFLFHQLSNGRDFALDDLMLSKQTVQGVELVDRKRTTLAFLVIVPEVWTMPFSAEGAVFRSVSVGRDC